MLAKGAGQRPEDVVTPEEEIKDPLVLEFLGLKDEYSEAEIEEDWTRRAENPRNRGVSWTSSGRRNRGDGG